MRPNKLGPTKASFKTAEYGDVCDLVDVDAENVAQVAAVAEPLDISDLLDVCDLADVVDLAWASDVLGAD